MLLNYSPSSFFSVCLCYYFNFAPAAVLCISSVCAEHFEGTLSFASIRFFFFIICLQISDLSLSFSLLCFVCCLLWGFLGFKPFPLIFLWFFMVSGSEVRVICPSVSFFFARLGVALGVSGDFLPLAGDFVFAGYGLSVVIRELSPILGQSLAWFEGEIRRMAEVWSSELETGLSSNGSPEGGDTAVSAPRVVRAFHALEEVCGLDEETMSRFNDRFQFPDRVRVRQPTSEDRA